MASERRASVAGLDTRLSMGGGEGEASAVTLATALYVSGNHVLQRAKYGDVCISCLLLASCYSLYKCLDSLDCCGGGGEFGKGLVSWASR